MRLTRLLPFRRHRPAPRPVEAPRPARTRWHSVSSCHEYERCPLRYRFGYVDRIAVERDAAPEAWRFGSLVHRGLEAGYRHHQAVGRTPVLAHAIPAAVEALHAAAIEEGFPEGSDALARAEAVVRGSLATTRLPPDEIVGVEHWFRARTDDGLAVAGAADLVLRPAPDTVEIRDHKVTRYVRTPEELAGDFQLGLYGWLALQTWPWARRVAVSHHYPLTREVVRAELTPAAIAVAIEHLGATARRAETDASYAPTPGEHCASCPYTERCPLARAA